MNTTPGKKIDTMARVGLASRAAVYALIGIFGVLVAFGIGGRLMDTRLALRELLTKPFGSLFLIALAVGLFAYAIWRFLQAWRDPDGHGTDGKGIAIRTGYVLGGIIHALLGFYAMNLIFHLTKSSNSGGEQKFAGWILNQQFGKWLLILVALGIFAFAIGTIYNAVTEKFARELSVPRRKEWLLSVCKAGLISRGVVFAIVGWLFLQAALNSNSREASGLRGVWQFLAEMPFGNILIAVVSAGFIAFSVYGITEALYRRSMVADFR